MKFFLSFKNKSEIPNVEQMLKYMWESGNNFSKSGNWKGSDRHTTLALSWDKWLDDSRWSNHPKFKEYIYFSLQNKRINLNYTISVEIDDDAVFVDKRAFFKAILLIAKSTKALIGIEKKTNLVSFNEFLTIANEYIEDSFSEATEKSLD